MSCFCFKCCEACRFISDVVELFFNISILHFMQIMLPSGFLLKNCHTAESFLGEGQLFDDGTFVSLLCTMAICLTLSFSFFSFEFEGVILILCFVLLFSFFTVEIEMASENDVDGLVLGLINEVDSKKYNYN